ncbi:hypothetical protein GN244_ATG16199 [Phytophthora infestans]|uniref:Uncharacterized protein n=1 Tax=Phytophthora infestans TaxID=4787 RepID=A0A833SU66_PHYIN|nr:hypothetical protein GN244_ATG16199 [Phytophthora infestans]
MPPTTPVCRRVPPSSAYGMVLPCFVLGTRRVAPLAGSSGPRRDWQLGMDAETGSPSLQCRLETAPWWRSTLPPQDDHCAGNLENET